MPVMEVNGVRLNVMQISPAAPGPAEDLVMVHGLAANMAFWLQDYASHFAQRFRITLYDLRGHGRSQRTESGYTPDDVAADLNHLLDHLDIGKAHIMAHSYGGIAAMKFACKQPKRVSSLVLADTQIGLGREAARIQPWITGDVIQAALKKNGIALDVHDPYFGFQLITEIARFRQDGKTIPDSLYPWFKHVLDGNNQRTSEKWLSLMKETAAQAELMANDGLSAEELKKIICPILALYGENSQSMATGRILESLWPYAQFITVPEAGHFFPRAKPDLIMSFCDQFWDGDTRERKAA